MARAVSISVKARREVREFGSAKVLKWACPGGCLTRRHEGREDVFGKEIFLTQRRRDAGSKDEGGRRKDEGGRRKDEDGGRGKKKK